MELIVCVTAGGPEASSPGAMQRRAERRRNRGCVVAAEFHSTTHRCAGAAGTIVAKGPRRRTAPDRQVHPATASARGCRSTGPSLIELRAVACGRCASASRRKALRPNQLAAPAVRREALAADGARARPGPTRALGVAAEVRPALPAMPPPNGRWPERVRRPTLRGRARRRSDEHASAPGRPGLNQVRRPAVEEEPVAGIGCAAHRRRPDCGTVTAARRRGRARTPSRAPARHRRSCDIPCRSCRAPRRSPRPRDCLALEPGRCPAPLSRARV